MRHARPACGPSVTLRTSQPDLRPHSAVSVLRAHLVLPPVRVHTLGQLREHAPFAVTTSRRFPECVAATAAPLRLMDSLRVPARPSFSVTCVTPAMVPSGSL